MQKISIALHTSRRGSWENGGLLLGMFCSVLEAEVESWIWTHVHGLGLCLHIQHAVSLNPGSLTALTSQPKPVASVVYQTRRSQTWCKWACASGRHTSKVSLKAPRWFSDLFLLSLAPGRRDLRLRDRWFADDAKLRFDNPISFLPAVAGSSHVAAYETKHGIKSACK